MDGEEQQVYDSSHRAFLQAFISRATLTFRQAKPILAAIFTIRDDREVLPGDVTESDFNSYVSSLNAAISSFDLEIRATFTQTTPRHHVFALVNTTSDPVTQLATTHTAEEIAFLQRVLDDMFEKYNTPTREVMGITSIQALQVKNSRGRESRASGAGVDTQTSASSGLTGKEAERMLKSLVDEGWFEKHRDHYTLSPRALIELRNWLITAYNEPEEDGEPAVERIKLCYGCREIVTIGQRCPTRHCKTRLHDACTSSFFRTQGGQKRCPLCKADWTGEDVVGPEAAGSKRDSGRPNGAGDASNSRQRRTSGPAAQIDQDDSDE
ncbi:MAG: hypothetical protein M1828_005801 [Chrysothrix sp. TS-e1954]|nr:MAG: hypothetical protein M1828_005801 [Chrysothrix sp. TS-e1954]